ncbi:uncharacterized protein Tco025E_05037 [Trypanosoma conorhini]|uniref:Uncharacterized protein n=1 Tax=Trypanosoma conorhini TaxID=83891 RepID=A0A422PGI0_9TRYP|nr:uncharacterized protein Tco025E_05037 [Trypanosoma conorhini]RNF16807.1 hypothetical protein Tco025E_05037 [Trypanosoma conorhini]
MSSAFSGQSSWRTPFCPPSAEAADAPGKSAAPLGALPLARPCRKRPRTAVSAQERWGQQVRHTLDSLCPAGNGGAKFSRRHVVLETCRVLHDCWQFRGRPQDAFEPAHSLSKVAQHLLTAYAGYGLTEDGQYLFLQAEERMPYVGFLLVLLQRLLAECDESQGDARTTTTTTGAAVWPQRPPHPAGDGDLRLVTVGSAAFDRLHGHPDAAGHAADAGVVACGDRHASAEALLHEVMEASNGRSVVLLADCRLTEEDVVPLAKGLRAEYFPAAPQAGCECGVMCLVPGAAGGTEWAAGGTCRDATLRQAVSCGRFGARSVTAHALLLGPMGPLLICLQRNGHSQPRSGSGNEADEARLWEWLQCFVRVPQPTVIVQWGGNGRPMEVDALFRLTSLNDGGDGDESPLRRYRRFSAGDANHHSHGDACGCGCGFCGTVLVLYARGATLTLESVTSSAVGAGVCQVWCVRISPHC